MKRHVLLYPPPPDAPAVGLPSAASAMDMVRHTIRETDLMLGESSFAEPGFADLPAPVRSVGFWDLGVRAGRLEKVIDLLNAVQDAFEFFQILAPVPSGLLSRPERVQKWARTHLGRLTAADKKDITSNVLSDDFFGRAGKLRQALRLRYLVGFAPGMIAGTDRGQPFWNFFTDGHKGSIIISAHDVRSFAEKAGRPFEAALALLAVAQLLVEANAKLFYHAESRGCLLDMNQVRGSIVAMLHKPRIEDSCLALIEPAQRDAATAMVRALHDYRSGDDSPPRRRRNVPTIPPIVIGEPSGTPRRRENAVALRSAT